MQCADAVECRRELRLEALHGLAKGVVAPDEDARVPQVIPAFDQDAGRLRIRLLDEALHLGGGQVGMQPRADLDVAISGRGVRGRDAQDDQVAALRGAYRLLQRRSKCINGAHLNSCSARLPARNRWTACSVYLMTLRLILTHGPREAPGTPRPDPDAR